MNTKGDTMPEPKRPEPNHKKVKDTTKARAAAKASAARKRKLKKKNRLCTAGEMAAINAYLDPACKTWKAAVEIAYPNRKGNLGGYATQVSLRPAVIAELKHQRTLIQSRVRQKTELTAEKIIEQCRRLAFTDITDILQYRKGKDPNGCPVYMMKMTDFEDLTPDIKAAIKDIEVETTQIKGQDDLRIQKIKIRMYDKQAALRDLGKHFNLFVEKIDVSHSGTIGHVHTSMAEMRTMFESMTQEDREAWIVKRMKTIRGEDDENAANH